MQGTSFYPDNYRRYLTEAFENRSLRNPAYSLRAFARDLGVGVSTLTEVLQGKYGLSEARVAQIAKALSLSKDQLNHFIDLVKKDHSRNPEEREEAKARIQERVQNSSQTLALDGFRAISDWYHMALLELISLPSFKPDPAWMAKRLDVPVLAVTEALDRLERLGLLERNGKTITLTEDLTTVGTETPSQAVRKFHRQILEKAIVALEVQSVEERENSSTVFAINKADLPEAKKKLAKFRREFSGLLSKTSDKDDVYCLSLQFFSLIKRRTNEITLKKPAIFLGALDASATFYCPWNS